jgi:MFS family permease
VRGRIRATFADTFRPFGDAFSNPDLRRIILAWTATQLGRYAYLIAIAVYAFGQGGATAVALVVVIRTIPAAATAPFTSSLGDRFPRKRVMYLTNLGQVLTTALAALVILVDGPSALVYVLVTINSIVVTTFRPTQAAFTPSLARTPSELTATNVASSTIESFGQFVAPAFGGVLLAATSVGAVFLVTSAMALVSAVLIMGIHGGSDERRPVREGKFKAAFAGFGALFGDPALRTLAILSGGQVFVAGVFGVLIVVTALDLLGVGSSGLGALNSAVGIGGLVGAVVAAILIRSQRLTKTFATGMLMWSIPIALVGIFANMPAALVLLFVAGVGTTVVDGAELTLMQRAVREDVLARVFGAFSTMTVLLMGLGSLTAPALIDTIGVRGALVADGLLLPVLTALVYRRLSTLDRGAVVAEGRLDLLRSNPIFAPLPEVTLEAIAGQLVAVTAGAGDAIFRQGDHGDRYYLVAEGRVDVSVDGVHTRSLERGEGFGEIALLRDLPRTATVTAATPVELFALERDHFLPAVTGHSDSANQAEAMVASRVGALRPTELEAV